MYRPWQLAFLFVVHWGDVGRATYLCLDCTKNMHTNGSTQSLDWNGGITNSAKMRSKGSTIVDRPG